MDQQVHEPGVRKRSSALSVHVLLLDAGKVLLTHRALDAPYAPGLWHAGVAGKVTPGEDVVAAAVREAREELGVVVAPAELEFAHVVHSHEAPYQDWTHFFFTCRRWEGTPANAEPHKHTAIGWWPAHQLPADTVDYCAQAISHLLLGTPFSQHRTPNVYPALQTRPVEGEKLGDAGAPGSLARVLADLTQERRRQQTLYGVQDFPSGTGPEHACAAAAAQASVDTAGADLTWWDLAFEELCEARAANDPAELYTELVQTCAVLVQWAQSLPSSTDTRKAS